MHIFFTDLDGTLLNRDSEISPKTMDAIKAYMKAGNIFVISSGRPLSSIQGVIDRSGLPSDHLKIISNNGSLIYDVESEKALLDLRMPKEDAIHIIDVAEKMGLHGQTYNKTNVICRHNDPEIDFYISHTKMEPAYAENLLELMPEDPYKAIAISLKSPNELVALQQALSNWMKDKYISFFSSRFLMEFVDKRSGKGNAVKFLCNYFRIPVEEAYAAGDAENDLTMLMACGNSIAMKNATDEVKSVAKYITQEDNDNDGLADILMKLANS